ncbi:MULTISPECIES: hypothetical protein [Flavobacteriaceae]|uniref:hypothetical protein n=1 Tax=Flavobacteriaceae TaxID=49546 RepID=UPI001491C675|nr:MULTISPECIES: hypothetical protein [Allomuricauda]MDC6367170.1 hypothetical protein [Muricauda sp. AC10]
MYQSIFAILLVMFVSCSTNKISEEQAIRIAEKFIVQNGYTNSEIKIDTNQIAADFGETQMSKDRILELRYNTLEPHVSFKSKKMGKWTFGFRNSRDSSRYQLVKLSGNGKKIWVVHQDVKVEQIQN